MPLQLHRVSLLLRVPSTALSAEIPARVVGSISDRQRIRLLSMATAQSLTWPKNPPLAQLNSIYIPTSRIVSYHLILCSILLQKFFQTAENFLTTWTIVDISRRVVPWSPQNYTKEMPQTLCFLCGRKVNSLNRNRQSRRQVICKELFLNHFAFDALWMKWKFFDDRKFL